MSAPIQNAQQNNKPINNSTIKALRHLLNGLDALQKLDHAECGAYDVASIVVACIGREVERIGRPYAK